MKFDILMMPAQTLTDYDRRRYDRQMLIRGFGEEGQEKLKNARAFIAGCGGLGSPIAYYMAVAGFGTLVIADMDIVDLSNLNRQILHWDQNARWRARCARTRHSERAQFLRQDSQLWKLWW
jgi:adenylyltransferase/sulfurtransferase